MSNIYNIENGGPGWGFYYIGQGEEVHYFDQYYSFSETKWKASSKKINEVMIAGYVPTRRASNPITFIYCVWKKMIKGLIK